VLKLSPLGDAETGKHACQDAGIDGFLTWPVHPAELAAMIRTPLPRDTPAEAAHER
jgi:DNA-binding response OmpR family regulator